jgi:hypothetical protein
MGSNTISMLLINKGQDLIKKLIPKIIDIIVMKSKIDPDLITKVLSMDKESIKQGGIDKILNQEEKIGTCIPTELLKEITTIRNSMMGILNAASISVNTLSKTLDPLKISVNTATNTVTTTTLLLKTLKISIPLIPTPPPGIPHPGVAALVVIPPALKLIDALTTSINDIQNQINSTQGAIDSINPIFTKITNLFKIIDKYILGCNVDLKKDLIPLSPSLQALDNAQKQQVLDAQNVNAVDFPSSVYKGFTLDIVKESFSPTVDRVKAVAKNPQGIVLLQTPLSFTTTPQVLVSEIKLIIDSNPNLKAE